MEIQKSNFSLLCGDLCNVLYMKDYDKSRINSIIDELNTIPYNAELFVSKNVGILYDNIKN